MYPFVFRVILLELELSTFNLPFSSHCTTDFLLGDDAVILWVLAFLSMCQKPLLGNCYINGATELVIQTETESCGHCPGSLR